MHHARRAVCIKRRPLTRNASSAAAVQLAVGRRRSLRFSPISHSVSLESGRGQIQGRRLRMTVLSRFPRPFRERVRGQHPDRSPNTKALRTIHHHTPVLPRSRARGHDGYLWNIERMNRLLVRAISYLAQVRAALYQS